MYIIKMTSFLNKLNFEINKVVKFKDPKMQLAEAVYKKNNEFKREDILHSMNLLAQKYNSNQIHLGCAIHYKYIDKWAPAIMKPTNSQMEIWSPVDSPGVANAYDGDIIDSVHFIVMNYNANNHTTKAFYTPQIGHHLH